jgi:hypothetical protein
MKLVINTQFRENYGDETNPRWKYKGGETYVVRDITTEQRERILREGIPTLRALIEYSNSMSEEYVRDYDVVVDSARECEPWESVTVCTYTEDAWHASVETLNGEYGYLRSDISRKLAVYTMLPGGERGDYTVEYYDKAGARMDVERLTAA